MVKYRLLRWIVTVPLLGATSRDFESLMVPGALLGLSVCEGASAQFTGYVVGSSARCAMGLMRPIAAPSRARKTGKGATKSLLWPRRIVVAEIMTPIRMAVRQIRRVLIGNSTMPVNAATNQPEAIETKMDCRIREFRVRRA